MVRLLSTKPANLGMQIVSIALELDFCSGAKLSSVEQCVDESCEKASETHAIDFISFFSFFSKPNRIIVGDKIGGDFSIVMADSSDELVHILIMSFPMEKIVHNRFGNVLF